MFKLQQKMDGEEVTPSNINVSESLRFTREVADFVVGKGNVMKTLGIDLSSMPGGTSACLITWEKNRAVAAEPVQRCTDATLDKLIGEADVIGIDAPLGWPVDFVNAVAEWFSEEWNEGIRDQLRLRETDRFVHRQFGLNPLSVSTDRIALPAMRAMALLKRHGVTDRSGAGRFFEVYPAGSLTAWKLPAKKYKKKTATDCAVRSQILSALCEQMPWLEVPGRYSDDADDLDSLIASLTTRAAFQGFTCRPTDGQADLARSEGWIHIPNQFPSL